MWKILNRPLLVLIFLAPLTGVAQKGKKLTSPVKAEPAPSVSPPEASLLTENEKAKYEELTNPAFRVTRRFDEPRNAFWFPLISYVLPGFDQWWEGQYMYAGIYSGTATLGVLIQSSAKDAPEKFGDMTSRDPELRRYLIGSSLFSLAGGMSAYHSFRTAVSTDRDRFYFLDPKLEESPGDLALAPFHFSYVGRHTTWIPLGIGVALVGASLYFDTGTNWYGPSAGDGLMAGAMSYSAGVNEEAAFRGYLMPVLRTGVKRDWASNLITSGIFAAAHIASDHRVPWPQFIMGYYLGYLTQANGWTLGESIFVHTWWDVIAFLAAYGTTQKIPPFVINTPQIVF